MQHSMKTAASGLCVALCSLLIAGCAGTGTREPVNYNRLPGSGDQMAEGPGLMSPARGDDYDDGVRVYSDDASKPALINRDNRARQTAGQPRAADDVGTTAVSAPSAAQEQEFSDYEAYQRFRNMPKDSPEYQRFKDWQEWKQYQQWKNSQQR